MNITKGLFSHSVLQRNETNLSSAEFSGECSHGGALKAYITCRGEALEGFYPLNAGAAGKGGFSGCIEGLPAGGPYDIKLVIESQAGIAMESTDIYDVLVGDVWILAGQSNMEGIGYMKDALAPDPMVRAFYMDDRWDVAQDPLHELGIAVDQVHVDLCGGARPERIPHLGVGPGLSFAQEMHKITGIPQGVIACAHGGTSMAQWDPALGNLGGKSLYGAMLRRVAKNGGRAAGVLWYQGCNDTNPEAIPLYTARMKDLAASMRRDFNNPVLPVVAVQLAGVCYPPSMASDWNAIQEQQRLLPGVIENLLVVPAIDLSMDDWIHISGLDHKRLGIRCAGAMAALTRQNGDVKPPITLKEMVLEKDPLSGSINIIVSFDNVVGKLQSQGRPSGFELTEKAGELSCHSIYRIDLDGDRVILKTTFNYMGDAQNQFLYYGLGVKPYCNITDAADRSLPVMGPLRVGRAKAFSVATMARVSKAFPSAGRLETLSYPESLEALGLTERNFYYMFLNTHDLLIKGAPEDVYLYYLIKMECEEKMPLNLYLGYDGPVKMWVDGKEIFHDPDGENPANVDDFITPLEAGPGQHEILVALGSNNCKAWGIFLRLERTDVQPEFQNPGFGQYKLPKLSV